ncbi:MAG: redoxin domain-containing protein, partial [Pseudonocardiaceae bacterium]
MPALTRSFACAALFLAAAGPAAAQGGGGAATAIIVSGPDVGRQAPDFTLRWATKEGVGSTEAPYQLWRDRGKTVVIAFYPKDFTSGCTAEMRTFAEQYDSLFGSEVV